MHGSIQEGNSVKFNSFSLELICGQHTKKSSVLGSRSFEFRSTYAGMTFKNAVVPFDLGLDLIWNLGSGILWLLLEESDGIIQVKQCPRNVKL